MILPSVREFFDEIGRQPALAEAVRALRRSGAARLRLTGLNPTAQAVAATLLHRMSGRPVVLIAPSNQAAEALAETAGAIFEMLEDAPKLAPPMLLPARRDALRRALAARGDQRETWTVLWRMADGAASVVVAPVAAALLKTAKPDFFRNLAWTILKGDEFFLEDLEQGLRGVGHT
ncbi:MAG: hypothetical protein R2724_03435 [Bryobacterales bacterium]